MKTPQDVLDYWFGPGDPDDSTSARFDLWFGTDDVVDATLRERFLPLIEEAALGRLESWKEHAPGRLAWTLLLDQFTRNVYRGTYRMFAYDALALQSTREAIASGQDRELPVLHRAFLYLPLEHAEDISAQDESIAAYRRLVEEAPPGMVTLMESMLGYAERHAIVIRRFGRYPHRNAMLSRTSTPEELAFLDSPAAPF